MKKSFIIVLLGVLIGFIGFTSCEDFLEADNNSAITADEMFSTQEGYENLVNQAYFSLRSIYNDPAIYCAGTDLYVGIRAAGDQTLEGYTLTSDNGTVKELYIDLYAVINAANAVLYYADKSEAFAEKALRQEEARFIRAYAYYVLSQQFGRVPIIKDYINTAENYYPRTTLEETYQFIIDELVELSCKQTGCKSLIG